MHNDGNQLIVMHPAFKGIKPTPILGPIAPFSYHGNHIKYFDT